METAAAHLDDLTDLLGSLPGEIQSWDIQLRSGDESTIERIMQSLDETIEIISLAHSFFRTDRSVGIPQEVQQTLLDSLDGLLNICKNRKENCLELLERIDDGVKVGRPKAAIDEEQVHRLRSINLPWNKISQLLGVSDKTLRRRRLNFLHSCPTYSECSDDDLDSVLCEITREHPNAGERIVQGHLVSKGLLVKRWRIRASLKRIDPGRSERMYKRRIRRRSYSVPAPNSLW